MNSDKSVYLDYNATTPLDPQVYERVSAVLRDDFGNPSSLHAWGNRAAKLVEEARESVAKLIGAKTRQVYFTGGATEGSNLVIKGILPTIAGNRKTILSSNVEHPAVNGPMQRLVKDGFNYKEIKVDSAGFVTSEALKSNLSEDVSLFAVIGGHNEFGTIQSLDELAKITHAAGARIFVDAVQLVGKVPVDVSATGIDYLVLSGHKFYAPKGVGAVFIKDRPEDPSTSALLSGGGQEHDLRSGTLNVPGIVGLGEAAKICLIKMKEEKERLTLLRNDFLSKLKAEIPELRVNGALDSRVPGNLNITIPGIESAAIINAVPELGLSTGSACSSDSVTPSPALLALGLSEAEAFSTLRICVGRFTSQEDVDFATSGLVSAVKRIKRMMM